jgi:hypothetical protein
VVFIDVYEAEMRMRGEGNQNDRKEERIRRNGVNDEVDVMAEMGRNVP